MNFRFLVVATFAICSWFQTSVAGQCALDAQTFGRTCRVTIYDAILHYNYRPSSPAGFCGLSMIILGQPQVPGYRRETAWLVVGFRQTQFQVPCCNACTLSVEPVAILNEIAFGAFDGLNIPPSAIGLTAYFQGVQLWWVSQPPNPEVPIIEATAGLALTFR